MILTFIFWVLLVLFMLKAFSFAFSMTWGLVKIMFSLFLFPLVLIILVISGLVVLAVPLLAIVGIITLICVQDGNKMVLLLFLLAVFYIYGFKHYGKFF